MVEQNVRQRIKQLPSMEVSSHRPSSLPPGSTRQSWETHFFRRDPISNKGDNEEIFGDGSDIHHRPSDESNQQL